MHGTKIPVVASDIPPHRQLLVNVPDYDWFFPVGNTQELTQRITDGLTNDAKAQHLAAGEREYVRANYNWPKLADATLREYRRVVASRRTQTA